MASLVLLEENKSGPEQRWELGETVVVAGRGADCAIKLTDQRASRRHFQVYPRAGAHFIADLDSANGTQLNGKALVSEVQLMPGDRIRVGQTVLVYELHKGKGLGTIISELEQESRESGKGFRTMMREISKDIPR